MPVLPKLEKYIAHAISIFDEIPDDRKELLIDFSSYIAEKIQSNKCAKLNFICTHNSRRSHMSQIWAQTAAHYYGTPNVECFSGGTEATAFNPRAVKAIESAGFAIEQSGDIKNPFYLVRYSMDKNPLQCFSKTYDDRFNPQKDFAAIMTCSDADEKCPVILGADERFPIRYEDPKKYDNTDMEETIYAKRSMQIATEMLFTFSKI